MKNVKMLFRNLNYWFTSRKLFWSQKFTWQKSWQNWVRLFLMKHSENRSRNFP